MQFDGMTMRACLDDLRAVAAGARLQRIAQISPLSLSLLFWAGKQVELIVSAHSEAACLFVARREPASHQQPSPFCSVLRRLLIGKRLDSVSQHGWDRIAILRLLGRDELGDTVAADLVIETMGKHSNIICVRADGRIVDAAKRVGRSRSRIRQVLPGLTYALPPQQHKLDPDKVTLTQVQGILAPGPDEDRGSAELSAQELQRRLLGSIGGLGPPRARQIARLASLREDASVDELATGIHNALQQLTGRTTESAAAEIEAVEEAYARFLAGEQGQLASAGGGMRRPDSESGVALAAVRMSLDRASRKLKATSAQLAEVGDSDSYRLQADAILGSLAHIRATLDAAQQAGEARATVMLPVYGAGTSALNAPSDEVMELDTGRDPAQVAKELYAEYASRKRRRATLEALVKREQTATRQLQSLEFQLSEGPGPQELEEILAEAIGAGVQLRPKARAPAAGAGGGTSDASAGPRKYTSPGGLTILVGRNNRQNEGLVRRGGSDDLWLHARGVAGAHVLLRAAGTQATEEDILFAAAVAARHSQARGGSRVAVDVCPLSQVRKPRGGPPGLVNYSGERTVYVEPLSDEHSADVR